MTGNGPSNVAPTGGASATLSGLNFNSIDPTPSLELSVSCRSTSWTSATMVTCAPTSLGAGTSQLVLRVSQNVGTGVGLLSFDAPVVSSIGPSDIAPTGVASVSISGHNFNSIDLTPTALLGVSLCCTSWISATMLACALASYGGGTAQIAVTLSRVVGTGLGSFSFDGAHPIGSDLSNRSAYSSVAFVARHTMGSSPIRDSISGLECRGLWVIMLRIWVVVRG